MRAMRLSAMAAVCALVAAGLSGAIGSGSAEEPPVVQWHESDTLALEAARVSGKPIYFFIIARDDPNSQYMWEYTLRQPGVLKELARFELCIVNSRSAANAQLVRRLLSTERRTIGNEPSAPPTQEAPRLGYVAASVFTDSRGSLPPLFIAPIGGVRSGSLYGAPDYLQPEKVTMLLRQVSALDSALKEVGKRPADALAHTELGHLYLELSMYDKARKHLQRAIELDGSGSAGARADAELGLLILDLPVEEDRQVAHAQATHAQLERYVRQNAGAKRELQARYYMGVCSYIAGDSRRAMKELEYFYGPDKPPGFNQNPWTAAALGLLNDIRRENKLPDLQ